MKLIATAITLFSITAIHAEDFAASVKASLEKAAAAQVFAVPGADANWRFLVNELKHLQHGDIATADLAKINVEGTDPLPAIVKYNDELKALGVELLLVPVPPKAAIYPEKLAAGATMDSAPSLAGFQKKLTDAGVAVLDLEAAFKKAKTEKPDAQLYCATDSHWSPHGAQLAAALIAEKYKSRPELIEHQLRDLVKLKESTLEFHGDLLTDADKAAMPVEKLPVVKAGVASDPNGTEVEIVESADYSPVMVIGDSHCQVFRRGGNMHTTSAGFIDHLVVDLSAPVHEISTQASGGEGPRIEIARATVKNPDFWAKKKIVVWLFTAREFTQGRWKILPAKVEKK
jgi:alginate O-acetyltransferase complex protein AlgJ